MNVVFLGVAVVAMYFTLLHIIEPHLNKHTDRIMQYSANLWITLGGIALLASYHQSRKDDARRQAELALRLSEKWGDINTYLADKATDDHRLTPLIRLFYGQEQGPIDMTDPYVKLAIDYIIEKCYEMWVLSVAMDINLSRTNTRTDYSAVAERRTTTALSNDATQPVHLLVGSVFIIPEFYLLLSRGQKFYPKAFIEYVNKCISLYRSRKNPRTGRAGFRKDDTLNVPAGAVSIRDLRARAQADPGKWVAT